MVDNWTWLALLDSLVGGDEPVSLVTTPPQRSGGHLTHSWQQHPAGCSYFLVSNKSQSCPQSLFRVNPGL